jgi:hypothetical protein
MDDGVLNKCKGCKRGSSRSKWHLNSGPSKSGPDGLNQKMPSDEVAKWIPGLEEKYAVSNFGKAFSLTKDWKTETGAKRLKLQKRPTGYYEFAVSANGGRTDLLIHRAVLFAFVGPPKESQECRHLNGDKSDNRLENLEWNTSRKNWKDTVKHGNALLGEDRYNSKLTSKDVYQIRQRRAKKSEPYKQIAKDYPVSFHAIRLACIGRNWKHVKGPIEGEDY